MNLADAVDYLISLDAAALIAAFSVSVLLDIPRYTFGFLAVLVAEAGGRRRRVGRPRLPSISVIIPGHNEARGIRRCVLSLREQTVEGFEIICVDDGSTDGMADELQRLRAEGLIDVGLVCRIRSGKSSACNLALSHARGDAVIIVDADCTFDRDAVENIVRPLVDPSVGAVSGDIAVRNAGASFITGIQSVEYLIGISLGKRVLDFLNVVACASGAFSAFRKSAVAGIGGMDIGPGEDLDLTLRLRQAGWRIRFAHDAWCLTDVPLTVAAFVRQRLRWERDALRIRLRKHRRILDPRNRGASVTDLVHQFDYVVTTLLVTLVFPLYVGWLILTYGAAAWPILGSVTIGYVVLDLTAFIAALIVVERPGAARSLPYALMFGVVNAYLLRLVRLAAYARSGFSAAPTMTTMCLNAFAEGRPAIDPPTSSSASGRYAAQRPARRARPCRPMGVSGAHRRVLRLAWRSIRGLAAAPSRRWPRCRRLRFHRGALPGPGDRGDGRTGSLHRRR